MNTPGQLVLGDGGVRADGAGVIHRQRESGTAERRDASDPVREPDRWRVAGLYVQPREHDNAERDRDR